MTKLTSVLFLFFAACTFETPADQLEARGGCAADQFLGCTNAKTALFCDADGHRVIEECAFGCGFEDGCLECDPWDDDCSVTGKVIVDDSLAPER